MAAGYWIRAQFRDDEVLVRCNATGAFDVAGGLAGFRYQPGGKIYKTRPDRLVTIDGATPEELETPPPKRKPGAAAAAAASSRPESEAIQLWTDGACTGNPGPAGAGVLYRYKGEVRELSEDLGHGTNNIAELTAILRGLQMVEDPSTPVDVMTDSSYCVGLLTQGWKAKANVELVAELRAVLSRFADARIIKVPGHAGVPDNERADALATGAIR